MLQAAPIRAAIRETYECLRPALDRLSHTTPATVRDALDNNAFIFSGFKTYHSLREVDLSLTKNDGHIKPLGEFKEDVRTIHERYNERYLDAEYEHAVGSALMADRWHASAPRSILEYRTAGDSKVRPSHEALDRTRLPKGDPFWQDFFPPNGWGCRCDAVEVLDDQPLSNSQDALERGNHALKTNKQELFRGNPGRDLRLFPDKHPYFGQRGIAHCSIARHASADGGSECEVLREVERGKEGRPKLTLTPELKARRKELQTIARERFAGTSVENVVKVDITSTCIKEILNQPHEHYLEKNELVLELPSLIQGATYLGTYKDEGKKDWVVQTHIFETTIEGDKSWIVALENKQGQILLHSISDSPMVIAKKR